MLVNSCWGGTRSLAASRLPWRGALAHIGDGPWSTRRTQFYLLLDFRLGRGHQQNAHCLTSDSVYKIPLLIG